MSSSQQEFEQCKIQLRDNIEKLIKSNFLQEAQELIAEYEAIVNNDVEIQLFKSKIEAMVRPIQSKVIEFDTSDIKIPSGEGDIFSIRNNFVVNPTEKGAPLVSIFVVAYNNLEKYTKTCIECILKYSTQIDYELILVDNGSNDGTFEFFQSVVHPLKKIIKITKNLGVFLGCNEAFKVAQGKFIVAVSNDIFVTEDWLSNMLKCAMSDERIGLITPSSDAVSNQQDANIQFSDFADMQKKAKEYNVSDPCKWHERLRLVMPMALYRKACWDVIGTADYGFLHDFADDDVTFRVRRAGYKAILCKDVFVNHAGGMGNKNPQEFAKSIAQGREDFRKKYYGIDAWDDVNNFENQMVTLVEVNQSIAAKPIRVLGVDVLCGTPILEVKNRLREMDIFDVQLSAFSTDAKYWLDLKTICEGEVFIGQTEDITRYFKKASFEIIILGQCINAYREPWLLLEGLLSLLSKSGQLVLKLHNTRSVCAFLEMKGYDVARENKLTYDISLEDINAQVVKQGFVIKNIIAIPYELNHEVNVELQNAGLCGNSLEAKLSAKEYVLKIIKAK